MQVTQVHESEKQNYNDFVAKHSGSFLQSWEWGNWQEQNSRKALRYAVKDTTGEIVLTAQLITHPLKFGQYYIYCPYGPVWNAALPESIVVVALTGLIEEITKANPTIPFMRIEPIQHLPLPIHARFRTSSAAAIQPNQTLTLPLSATPELLFGSFHEKTRYNIKLAQKHNVRVERFMQPDNRVIDLILNTTQRKKYRGHDHDYIQALWQQLCSAVSTVHATGYLASINGQPAASGLMIDFASTRMYLYGGSEYTLRQHMAPYLLHWTAIQDAQKKDYSYYDFGAPEAVSSGQNSFMKFKLGFNPQLVQFGGTHDIVLKPLLYKSYSVIRTLNRQLLSKLKHSHP